MKHETSIKRLQELAAINNPFSLKEAAPAKTIDELMASLVQMGLKKYQLDTFINYGVIFVALPFNAIPVAQIVKMSTILPQGCSIGHYDVPGGRGVLSIRTTFSA